MRDVLPVAVIFPLVAALCATGWGDEDRTVPESPVVRVDYAGWRANQPPLITRFFDLTLANHADGPRWFLLPASLTRVRSGGIHTLEVWRLSGNGQAVLGDFLGNGGFKAFLLPAHAVLQVRRLPIKSLERTPLAGSVPFEVVIASSLTLGGEPAESWYRGAPTSDGHAVVDAARATRAGARSSPGLKEVSVSWTEIGREAVTVEISGPRGPP